VEDVTYLIDGINSVGLRDAGVLIFFPPVFHLRIQGADQLGSSGIRRRPGNYHVTYKVRDNEFHGTAYEFPAQLRFRCKELLRLRPESNPPFKLNQFGFNAGGPVVIPVCITEKTSSSSSAITKATRPAGQTFLSSVPTAAFRKGDFSDLKTVVMDRERIRRHRCRVYSAAVGNRPTQPRWWLYILCRICPGRSITSCSIRCRRIRWII